MNPRRVFVGWFSLVALYTALTQSEKVAGLLGFTTEVTRRLSDPNVPLIKNRSGAALPSNTPATNGYNNSASSVYGSSGGQYIGSTFVPNPVPMDPRGGPKDEK